MTELLTEAEWARKNRDERPLKNKSYRRYWLGQEVGHFLRAKKQANRSQATLGSYETTLCAFTLDHRDIDCWDAFLPPGGEDLVIEFLQERWGDAAGATLDNRTGALCSFFKWAERSGRILRAPYIERKRISGQRIREAHELDEIRYIIAQQYDHEDEVGLLLMGRLGFRKMDVGRFQRRDVDIPHDRVFVRLGKGGKPAELPIAFEDVRDALKLWLAKPGTPEQYLWHPRGNPLRAPDPATVHRRFKRCLERAGVSDFPMHELRHSAGDRLWRETGDIYAAKQLLRHASVATTERYLHPTVEDLRARMRASDG